MAAINHRNPRVSSDRLGWLTILLFGFAGIASGLVASLGSPILAFIIVALFAAVVLIASPLVLLWVVLIGGLVLSGVAELYFPSLGQARWGVALAAIALGAASLVFGMWAHRPIPATPTRAWSSIATWSLLFLLIALFSAFLNLGLSFDTVVGLKGYFQVWGILLAFVLLPLRAPSVERTMMFLFWLGLIQLPFILHQHFVLVPQRSGIADAARGMVAQDILVGTFSGSMSGGGAGPAMAVLLLIALTIAIAMWRVGKISFIKLALASIAFFLPLAIGEHKIALVLLPVGLFVVFDDKVRRNPLGAIGLATISGVLLAVLFIVFTLLPRAGSTRLLTPDEYWNEMWSYNAGERGYGNYALNRTTVYPFWAKYHQTAGGSVIQTLVGHGPGSSKDARGGLSEHSLAAERFPGYGIGLTGISGLLWDTGVLGTLAVLGLLVSAYRTVRNLLLQTPTGSVRWANLKGAQAGIAMIGFSFLHNNMFLYEIGFQTMTMLLLGYVAYVERTLAPPFAGRKGASA